MIGLPGPSVSTYSSLATNRGLAGFLSIYLPIMAWPSIIRSHFPSPQGNLVLTILAFRQDSIGLFLYSLLIFLFHSIIFHTKHSFILFCSFVDLYFHLPNLLSELTVESCTPSSTRSIEFPTPTKFSLLLPNGDPRRRIFRFFSPFSCPDHWISHAVSWDQSVSLYPASVFIVLCTVCLAFFQTFSPTPREFDVWTRAELPYSLCFPLSGLFHGRLSVLSSWPSFADSDSPVAHPSLYEAIAMLVLV